jgi:hypothetical protein
MRCFNIKILADLADWMPLGLDAHLGSHVSGFHLQFLQVILNSSNHPHTKDNKKTAHNLTYNKPLLDGIFCEQDLMIFAYKTVQLSCYTFEVGCACCSLFKTTFFSLPRRECSHIHCPTK